MARDLAEMTQAVGREFAVREHRIRNDAATNIEPSHSKE